MRSKESSPDHDESIVACSDGSEARNFERARAARSSIIYEDYVELIDDLIKSVGEARTTDIARRLGVSHPTVVNTINRLKREDLADGRPYRGVFLTSKGQQLAAKVRMRHKLVVDVLIAMGVPPDAAASDAEGIEHHVSDVTLAAFSQFMKSKS